MKSLPLLDSLISPADLRAFTTAELGHLAEEIRYRIKETTSEHGGHLASNLGTVELILALHRVFDFSSDRLLWDIGHQSYPHKLVTGRATQFGTNRQEGGLSGFPDPLESPYDLVKVGHSSTAISTGVGVAEGYRALKQRRHTVVVVGDGALTGGMAFEGLINAGQLKSDLLVVLNDNGNFIDAPVGSLHIHLDRIRTGKMYKYLRQRLVRVLHRLPRGKGLERFAEHLELAAHKLITPGYIFEDLGFSYFGPVDGHNLAATEEALRRVAGLSGPVLLHVLTHKGGGWKPSQADPLKFHGPKGFDLETGYFHARPKAGTTYSQIFADTLLDLAASDPRLVAITAAMPSGTGLRAFGLRHPERLYDVGICEQHSFGFAEGLAVAGMLPVVAHYSTFAQRGFDQVFQEIVLQRRLGIVVILDRAGLVGEDGATHHGIYDLAWTRCFPGLVLLAPKDGPELAAMLRWCHQHRQGDERAAGYFIRYPKGEVPEPSWSRMPSPPLVLGRAEILRQAVDAAPAAASSPAKNTAKLMVWAYGATVATAWQALEEMGETAAGVTLVNARFAKPFDGALLAELAKTHDRVLTLEDHALPGGFGSIVAETVADLGLDLAIHRLGIRDELVLHASREQQLAQQGLDRAGVARRIRQLLDGNRQESLQFVKTG
jgi:1-deoxy-D-xylulose-5-phosphate synthase